MSGLRGTFIRTISKEFGANDKTASRSGVPFEIEKRLLGKDGRYRWFLFRYNPLLNERGRRCAVVRDGR